MIHDLLTFFQSEPTAGQTSTFPIQIADDPLEVWVFSRENVDLTRVAHENYDSLIKNLLAAIQPGGGLVVVGQPHNDVILLHIYGVEGRDLPVPEHMLSLSPFRDPQFQEIKGEATLKPGDHLVIPVSATAEAKLIALYNDLKGLPSDLSATILNVLRRPSLEWRIDRLERALSLGADARAQARSVPMKKAWRWASWFPDTFRRPVLPIGPAVLAALLLVGGTLAAASVFTNSKTKETESGVNQPATTTATPPVSIKKGKNKPKDSPAPTSLESSTQDLFTALQSSNDPDIKGLYLSHFKGNEQSPVPALAWGITKLQGLKLGVIQTGDVMLGDNMAWTAAKEAYRQHAEVLKGDDKAVTLLAWTWCKRVKKPEINIGAKDKLPLLLPDLRDCKDVNVEDAVAALDTLTDWVRGREE
jgi:hypothetical protein